MTNISKIITADYENHAHAQAIIKLMDHYSGDPAGGGGILSEYTKANLVQSLAKIPGAFSVLAYTSENPVGLINVFMGFSTFRCRPLLNIHDVVVMPEYRGQGISALMFDKVEQIGRDRDCCKLTLEVLDKNLPAVRAYEKLGFSQYELSAEYGKATFWQKYL